MGNPPTQRGLIAARLSLRMTEEEEEEEEAALLDDYT